MLVKFASLCDHCEKRSEEYTVWPKCPECFDEICNSCMKSEIGDDSHTEDEKDEYINLCKNCRDHESNPDCNICGKKIDNYNEDNFVEYPIGPEDTEIAHLYCFMSYFNSCEDDIGIRVFDFDKEILDKI